MIVDRQEIGTAAPPLQDADPDVEAQRRPAEEIPTVPLHSLDTLWFQVGGTICNLWCSHCFISCSPKNHKFGFMSRETVRRFLEESVSSGVKEYYFTGGEPFMNRDLLGILKDTLELGPATVLTNGILINPRIARKLRELDDGSRYSLEIRVSLDGFTEESNDAIRGTGSFRKALAGVKNLVEHDFLPIITATQTWDDRHRDRMLAGFQRMLQQIGYRRPRIKIIPPLRIGREKERSGGYERYEYVSREMMKDYDDTQLLCTQSRMVTDQGVYVCPILIDEPDARLSDTLQGAFVEYGLRHPACYTCYLSGAICHNFSGGSEGHNSKEDCHMKKAVSANGGRDKRAISVERAVRERYSQGAAACETSLCCPVDYDPRYLEVIPEEILERDYGCGDPSKYVQTGDTVLDLGSGAGKICYILSQLVGPEGRVIGVDMNEEMLRLANKYRREIGDRIGYHNVEFRRGKIQDLRLDLDRVDLYLRENPLQSAGDLQRFEEFVELQRKSSPLIPDGSIDLVVSNCVLNLVKDEDKRQLFREIYRVVKRGGRVAISDIVSDEDVPEHLKQDPELWSGCLSGALREDEFLKAFADVGFYGIEIVDRSEQPWQTVEGIEFRSITVTAYKGKEGPCLERKQAVIYRGPWKAVIDDDGHTLYRGERMAVCDKTFQIYSRAPYADDIIPVPPLEEVPLEEAAPFACNKNARRHPRETKGEDYRVTEAGAGDCCGPEGCC
jgi:ubiquinone/menaquinone biosynthesis C-methylase UbiE/uncharacterized Fe-S cluster-containing radical SAM superfamily protein